MKSGGRAGPSRCVGLLAAVAVLGGCAHVNEETFASEMDRLRQEMRAQDEAVEGRVTDRMDDQMNQMAEEMNRRLSALESELNALRGEFEVTVERLESAIRFNTPVHFAFDDATIRTQDQALLNRFASVVSRYYNQAIITVEGFTDPSGSAEYNLRLGQRRADSVRDYLVGAGVPAERMRTVSYGESPERQIIPDSRGPGEGGWQNRRVSMVIDFNDPDSGAPLAMN